MLFKLLGNQSCENQFFSVLPVVSGDRRFSVYPLKTKHRAKMQVCEWVCYTMTVKMSHLVNYIKTKLPKVSMNQM